MSASQQATLAAAGTFLVLGLILLFLRRRRTGPHQPARSWLVVAWLLLGLCAACTIFLFFPESTVAGKFGWGQATGAFGGFIVTWIVGTTATVRAERLDEREAEIRRQESEIQKLRASLPVGPEEPLPSGDVEVFKLRRAPKCRVGLVPGRIIDIRFADVWVNSENTNMQMARFYDRSVSGVIRYLGATRDAAGNVIEDSVAQQLAQRRGTHRAVSPGTVFDTGAGELANSHNVKRILHVAAVTGEFMYGYKTVNDVAGCVVNALRCAEKLAAERNDIASVLLPLLGTGLGAAPLEQTARALIDSILDHLEAQVDGRIRVVYVLMFLPSQRQVCRAVLGDDDRVLPGQFLQRGKLRATST